MIRARCLSALVAAALLASPALLHGQTPDARVNQLLSKMTLEQKLTLIHGTHEDPSVYQGQAGYLGGIPSLGIPGLRFADGPPGVLTRHPSAAETCTMGVAATFSAKDAEDNGIVIGREDRALGIDVSLQPFVNIDRDLEFGRAYNTFGEDPYLTSVMGAQEIKGIQAQHVMAQVKHFVGYDSDSGSTFIDDQTLHEVYVAPFDAAVKAGVSSMMCSYNRINGVFACGNANTLTTILRDQLHFQGFVTSDWGAMHAVNFIKAGVDMEMPGEPADGQVGGLPTFFDMKPVPPPAPPRNQNAGEEADMFGGHIPEEPTPAHRSGGDFGVKLDPKKMKEALADGTVTEADVTRAAGRVLYEEARFGYLDGQQKHEVTAQAFEDNAKVIEKTGEDSAVLLKNEGHLLPLRDLDHAVLIGPTAQQVDAIGINGERSVGLPQRQVGPLAALEKISGHSDVHFAVADNMAGMAIPASFWSNLSHADTKNPTATHPDHDLDFTSGNALAPDSVVTWKGTLNVPTAGTYWLYLQVLGTNAQLTVDGKPLAHTGVVQGGVHGDILQANQDNVVPTPDGLDNVRRAYEFTAGPHQIEISTTPDTSHAPVQVRLAWYTPEKRRADHDAAIAAAREAAAHHAPAVVFAWSRLQPVFGLPGDQNQLIDEIAAVNPNTVVVLNTTQPVALPWLPRVKAVLQMWWPGDEGGWSTANILLGKTSPAGRLPVTWGAKLTDYPATDPRHPERSKAGANGKTTYTEGLLVGYRWFDHEHIEPLFPFGFGLSYTTFTYSGLRVVPGPSGSLEATFTVRNTGSADSDEVPQAYLSAPSQVPAAGLNTPQFAPQVLVGFDRIHLRAGQSQQVTLHIPARQLQYWSTNDAKWVTLSASRTLSVGPSSRELTLHQALQ